MKYISYLKWVIFGGLALVFFVPFIIADGSVFPNMFFPFITGKNFAFRILIELLFGLYIILAAAAPEYRPRASKIMWVCLAFVAWVGLGTLLSVDPIKSFWSNFERMEGYITLLHLFLYFVMAGAILSVDKLWSRFIQVSIASSVVMGCYGLLQLAKVLPISSQSGSRLDTSFGNATYLAVFMLFNLFLTLFMLVRQRKSAIAQAVYGVALVLQATGLFYTQTRGALLGVIGGLIVAAIFIAWRAQDPQWKLLRKVSLWGLGIIAVLAVAFIGLRHTALVNKSQTLNRLASISLSDPTTQSRFLIWQMAFDGFKEKPIQGWGQENFSYVFNKYYSPQMYGQEQWFDRAHNQFIDWLIADGLPAFLLYIALFALAASAIVRSELEMPEQAILLGLLAGYAFNNLFVFDDLMSSVYFFTVIAFAHGLSRRALPSRLFLTKPVSERALAVIAPIVVIVVLVSCWVLNAPGIARAKMLVEAVTTQVPVANANGGVSAGPKDLKMNLQEFTDALGTTAWPGTPLGRQEVTEQLFQFANSSAQSTSIAPDVQRSIYVLAQSTGQQMLAQRKNDARLELFFGAFYEAYGQYPQAIQYLRQSLADSPKKQQIMFELGVLYLNSGDNATGVPLLKAAFDEEHAYKDARVLYAAGLYYSGDAKDADALLIEGFGTTTVDDPRMLQVYAKTKQYDRLIGVWQQRVAASPQDAQVMVGLASAYFAAGDVADTITALQKAAALNPGLAPQVQALISQIKNGTVKPGQ